MSKLSRQYINSNRVQADLEFGINENVILRSIDIQPRMYEGNLVKRNTFMTFTQVDPITRKGVSEHEYSFFNLNHDSKYVAENFWGKIEKLADIARPFGLAVDFDTKMIENIAAAGIPDEANFEDELKDRKKTALIDNAISEAFYEVMKDQVGFNSILLRMKTTVDKKGYLELPHFGKFIEPMTKEDTELSVTLKEYQTKKEALETKTAGADSLGKAPSLISKSKPDFSKLGSL